MRDIRVLNMVPGQKIEDDEVMKRIGELSYRNLGQFAKMSMYDTSSAKALIVGSGLRVTPSTGMIINVTAGDCFQTITSGTSGGNAVPCIQTTDQLVQMDAADGTIRTDIIEAQIISTTDKNDTVQIATVVTGTSGTGGSNIIVTNETVQRDIKYYLSARKKKSTTIPTAATSGELIGTVNLSGVVNLSSTYLINVQDGEDASYQEIDCRGADPVNTTRAEIISKINSVLGRVAAVAFGNFLNLYGNGLGETSVFRFKPPVTDAAKDALQAIFGVSTGGTYKYTYRGTNEWFKLAEIDLGAATATITAAMIRDITQKASWASQSDQVLLMDNLYNEIQNTGGKLPTFDDSSLNLTKWKDFQKLLNKSVNSGTLFANPIISTYTLPYTVAAAYIGAILLPNGEAHFVQYMATVGMKLNSSGVPSTYTLPYTVAAAYTGAILLPNGEAYFVPSSATVGMKLNSSGVPSTYTLPYTASSAYTGAILLPNGEAHFVPNSATVGMKLNSSGVPSTYTLPYTAAAYDGAILLPKGEAHFVPSSATVGMKLSSIGVPSTYTLPYTVAGAYVGAILLPNGEAHFVPLNATVGMKLNSSGVPSTYTLPYTHSAAYRGGILLPNGEAHFVPSYALVGTKLNSIGVPSTYTIPYTQIAAYAGGIFLSNDDAHFVPYNASVCTKIQTIVGVPFSPGICLSPFFNKF